MIRHTIALCILSLSILACGAQIKLPDTAISGNMDTHNIIAAPVPPIPHKMVVCNCGALNIRMDAGTDQPLRLVHPLPDGTIVIRTATAPKYPVAIPWYEVMIEINGELVTGWVFGGKLCEL